MVARDGADSGASTSPEPAGTTHPQSSPPPPFIYPPFLDRGDPSYLVAASIHHIGVVATPRHILRILSDAHTHYLRPIRLQQVDSLIVHGCIRDIKSRVIQCYRD